MLFSSPVFLFLFLPLTLLGYYLIRIQYRNYFLLLASMVFFAWGGVSYSLLLVISIIFNYLTGLGIGKSKLQKWRKLFLMTGVLLNLMFLAAFKYLGFILENLSRLFASIGHEIEPFNILLPIGISFYTFQAISYLVDVYRREVPYQRSIWDLGLFISLFPQLIAGPIVRYHEIERQIAFRQSTIERFAGGIRRFIIGLGKKVLIANSMGFVADECFGLGAGQLTTSLAWLGVVSYSLQIYFDFSGYSDMAIGLGKMFGFELPENFNFPYIAKSIKEFWRRWHISLSSWFKDYLYIPLGGNRLGLHRTYINLFIVFFVTGLWHGASWNFVVWGLVHGLFLVIEKLTEKHFPHKLPSLLQHGYTLFVVMMAWVLFRADNFAIAANYYAALFGFTDAVTDPLFLNRLINYQYMFFLLLGVMASFNVFKSAARLSASWPPFGRYLKRPWFSTSLQIADSLYLLVLFSMCAMYLLAKTYNPFIYYRF
jgi:alginate O-acetyltransferase complex protein AlgI